MGNVVTGVADVEADVRTTEVAEVVVGDGVARGVGEDGKGSKLGDEEQKSCDKIFCALRESQKVGNKIIFAPLNFPKWMIRHSFILAHEGKN